MSLNLGKITQIAFMTRDIQASIEHFVDDLGIGPWFVLERSVFSHSTYRGAPSTVDLTTAFAFGRGMEFELMQVNNDEPSMWRDAAKGEFVRERFHHWCIWPQDYDATLADARARGYETLQEGATPRGRFIYLTNKRSPDEVLELTESTPERRAFQKLVADAGVNWNGREHIRTGWNS